MKHRILFLFGLCSLLIFSACKDDEDMTSNLVGTYIGAFTQAGAQVDLSFEVEVKRIDNKSVSIEPVNGNDFFLFEIELERTNSSTLVAKFSTEPGDDVIIFTEIPCH